MVKKKKFNCGDCGTEMEEYVLHAKKNGKEVYYCSNCTSKYLKGMQEQIPNVPEIEPPEIEPPEILTPKQVMENNIIEDNLKQISERERILEDKIKIQEQIIKSSSEKKKGKDAKSLMNKVFNKKLKAKQEPILFLRNNGVAQTMFVAPEGDMYDIEGKKYHQRFGSDWELKEGIKTKKIKIIPEWGMYPLGNSDYIKELKAEDSQIQYDMIHAIQTAETVRYLEEKKGKQISPKLVVIGIIALIVVGYFIFAGGGG